MCGNTKVACHAPIRKAFVNNLLEDNDGDKLNIMRADDSGGEDTSLRLDFKGFEVKTVKRVVATERVVYLRRKSTSQLYFVIFSPKKFCRKLHS